MKIEPEKYYTLREAQKIVGIKARQTMAKFVEDGFLAAIEVGNATGKRYAITGEALSSFIERYNKGLVKKFTIAELKANIKLVLDYCKENNIKTLKELIEKSK